MLYRPAAVERAMRVQEVILRAMSGEMTWIAAAEVLGMSPRSLRRWRERYESHGYDGLLDRRRRIPSARRAPMAEVEKVLRLYRDRYGGFNVRHFHQIATREHGVKLSYSFVKRALQGAGLVKKRRARGRHRRRREPRACYGEMLQIDGSPHAWLSLRPDDRQTLVAVQDDATGRILYAQLWAGETAEAVMSALWAVFSAEGLPMSVYTDRAGWAFYTPRLGGRVAKEPLTQVGRALAELGVEHIPAYSPQAKGRVERLNRTLQDRLVNELRVRRVRSVAVANRYLRERFIPAFNAEFGREATDPRSAFVPVVPEDLARTLCRLERRVVAKDNTVRFGGVRLQIERRPGRASCAGLGVEVRRHLDGTFSVAKGKRIWGRYDSQGRPLGENSPGRGEAPGSALRCAAP